MDEQFKMIDRQERHQLTLRHKSNKWLIVMGIIGVFVLMAAAGIISYVTALGPVQSDAKETVRIVVSSGQTARDIAEVLYENGLIRSKEAFGVYTELSGTKNQLQAGGYVLSKAMSMAEIVDHLRSGKTDEMSITVLPGMTLKQLADPAVKGSLAVQGFSAAEIQAAFARQYDSVLFKDRPAGTDLEGYIYPETYRVAANETLDRVLKMSFDEFYTSIQKTDIEASLKAHNLTLFQGIILASIVQKEVSDTSVQPQVAQVFLKRLKDGIPLGSDVTFFYAAAREGRQPSVDDPSPYNTRKVGGLPPGPIANFHLEALQAVAHPAAGDYLYFVAGDDGQTYFARTEAEHEANVAAHCKTLCQ